MHLRRALHGHHRGAAARLRDSFAARGDRRDGSVMAPKPKLYGDRYTGTTPSRMVPTLPCSKAALPPINTDRWFRNGKYPDASVFSQMTAKMNTAVIARSKEVFSISG